MDDLQPSAAPPEPEEALDPQGREHTEATQTSELAREFEAAAARQRQELARVTQEGVQLRKLAKSLEPVTTSHEITLSADSKSLELEAERTQIIEQQTQTLQELHALAAELDAALTEPDRAFAVCEELAKHLFAFKSASVKARKYAEGINSARSLEADDLLASLNFASVAEFGRAADKLMEKEYATKAELKALHSAVPLPLVGRALSRMLRRTDIERVTKELESVREERARIQAVEPELGRLTQEFYTTSGLYENESEFQDLSKVVLEQISQYVIARSESLIAQLERLEAEQRELSLPAERAQVYDLVLQRIIEPGVQERRGGTDDVRALVSEHNEAFRALVHAMYERGPRQSYNALYEEFQDFAQTQGHTRETGRQLANQVGWIVGQDGKQQVEFFLQTAFGTDPAGTRKELATELQVALKAVSAAGREFGVYINEPRHLAWELERRASAEQTTATWSPWGKGEGPFSPEWWKAFRDAPLVQQRLGPEGLVTLERRLANITLSRLLEVLDRSQETTRTGQALLEFKSADIVPYVVLNAYRDAGGSGEFPFLLFHSRSEDTLLAKYVAELDPTVIDELSERQPDIAAIVRLIREHGATFRDPASTPSGAHGSWESTNPVYAEIQVHLRAAADRLLVSEDPRLQCFALRTLKRLGSSLSVGFEPSVYEHILARAETMPESGVRDEAMQALRDLLMTEDGRSNGLAWFLLGRFSELSPPVQELIRNTCPRLVISTLYSGRTLGSHERGQLVQALGMEASSLETTIALVELAALGPYRTYSSSEWTQFVELSTIDGILPFLRRFRQYGFELNLDPMHQCQTQLQELIRDQDAVAATIELIRASIPDYQYLSGHAFNVADEHFRGPVRQLFGEGSPVQLKEALFKLADAPPELAAELREGATQHMEAMAPSIGSQLLKLMPELRQQHPELRPPAWLPAYERLLKIQARSAREEYDLWATELDPLVAWAKHEGLLDPSSATDGEALLSYVQQYGMFNLPRMLRWHMAISRAETLSEIPADIQQELRDFGVDPDRLTLAEIPAAIERVRRGLVAELLADKIPSALQRSPLGQELFHTLKGSTSWERGHSVTELVAQWEQTLEQDPGRGRLPEGYREMTLRVPERVRKELSQDEEALRSARYQELLGHPDLVLIVLRYKTTVAEAFAHENVQAWWTRQRERILSAFDARLAELQMQSEEMPNEKARASLRRQIETLTTDRSAVAEIELTGQDEPALATLLESLAVALPRKLKGRDDTLRALSAMHMLRSMERIAPSHIEVLKRLSASMEEVPSRGAIRDWGHLLTQVLDAHYLSDDQNAEHTGHSPLPAPVVKMLRELWSATGKLEQKNIVVQTESLLRKLDDEGYEASRSTTEVTLVPSRGLLRIYAGDIGDACYTSKHEALARGEFPGLTAFTYVTGRGTKHERFRGSALVIETATPSGEKVLLLRANNPQQNLLGSVDADQLLQQTIGETIELAERRNAEYVVVPLDPVSVSSSNRPEVSDYYARVYGQAAALELVNTPETNFNGYANWNPRGANRCVVVWRRTSEAVPTSAEAKNSDL